MKELATKHDSVRMFSPAAVFLPQGCCRGRQGKDPHRRMADRVRPVQTVDIRYQTYYIVTEVPRSVNAPGPWVLAEKEGWRRARAPRPSAEPFACRKRARSSPAPLQNKSTPRWGMDLFWRRRRDGDAHARRGLRPNPLPAARGPDHPPHLCKTNPHPAGAWICFGGEGGIRTLETLLTPTRFPVARPRPS